MSSPSVAVVHPVDPNRPTVIPSSMYDPAVHTLWDERGRVAEPVADGLPADFPGRAELIAAGHTTVGAVRTVRDFDEIPGIGEKTEARIVAWLAGEVAE